MDMETDERFTAFLRAKAGEAKRAIGYHPTKFLGMLNAEGGFRTVKKLLGAPQVSDGFTKLFMGGRLDLSVEALVVESEWRQYFDLLLVARAEKTLRDAKYRFKPYELQARTPNATDSALSQSKSHPSVQNEKALPSGHTNSLSFSALCEQLGTPLKNVLDRWCGISEAKRRAVFTVWADRLIDGKYVYWDNVESPRDTRVGARELHETILTVMAGAYDAYGFLCEAEDPTAEPRKRKRFIEDRVLVLRFSAESPGIVAYVLGEVATADVIAESNSFIAPFPSAIDDLDSTPPGVVRPDRVVRASTGYRRDDAVRQYVLARARGHCEHCGELGFELPDGTRYLEAHHVIALADNGPDTVENVIALCPQHHREAHYGLNAEALEVAFIEKLTRLVK